MAHAGGGGDWPRLRVPPPRAAFPRWRGKGPAPNLCAHSLQGAETADCAQPRAWRERDRQKRMIVKEYVGLKKGFLTGVEG